MKDTKVMSDIEMSQIQVSNPLLSLSLTEGGGSEVKGSSSWKLKNANTTKKETANGPAKVMINPLNG